MNNNLINIVFVEDPDVTNKEYRLRTLLRPGNNLIVGDLDDSLIASLATIPDDQKILVMSTTAMDIDNFKSFAVTIGISLEHIAMYILLLQGCHYPSMVPGRVYNRLVELNQLMESCGGYELQSTQLLANSWANPNLEVSLLDDLRAFVSQGDLMNILSANFDIQYLIVLWNEFVLNSNIDIYSRDNPIDPSLGYPRYARMDLVNNLNGNIRYSISGPMGADGDFLRTILVDSSSNIYTPVVSQNTNPSSTIPLIVSLQSDRGTKLCC